MFSHLFLFKAKYHSFTGVKSQNHNISRKEYLFHIHLHVMARQVRIIMPTKPQPSSSRVTAPSISTSIEHLLCVVHSFFQALEIPQWTKQIKVLALKKLRGLGVGVQVAN